ncbi:MULTISPECIES: penicillin acylase family protein [Streptomyces]|uniref:Peptidase S45, penicillin amidase n=2 Tax=Streptomyces venezuelae TaxID=54571 RepID=F2RLR9_STRVP|nr:penicillin acylase family protein [Streptomyces venezuelae]APE25769.1 acyl-homoserine-lactone acylase [Streptomyces venezuelae]QES03105.1 penicillin acylase family protein [Streptomyces venezuelae ATCC 10712]CCA60449.1 peptidase S45, penicillin amidase [Streptomyces venezuelae ATCC 10712]
MARRRSRAGLPVTVAAVVAVMSTVAATGSTAATGGGAAGPDRPTIRYTEYGIPHIIASDWEGLGTGYGYAAAKDNICTLADTYLMVNAQRSRYLGPQGKASPGQNQNSTTNLNSDLYFQRIKDNRVVERLLEQPAPDGPEPEVREAIRGYVQGYNRYLAETGAGNLTDPACRGAAWVRPITELDVYRHAHAEIIMGSADALLDGQVNAAPPGASAAAKPKSPPPASSPKETAAKISAAMAVSRQQSMGSNALAVGSQGVSGGTSMLLANPHFPWQGKNRMWQSHLTIPGKVNVSGASLLGLPAVNIGYNDDVAWSHTVATVAPFGLFDVQVDPLNPTMYLVDGAWERMTSQQVAVDVRNPDGSLGKVTRTLWSTRYGPVTTSLQGVALPWVVSAHAVRDVNMNNLRALNTWFRLDQAKDVDDVVNTLETTQGVPFFNTIASDRKGKALYADIQATANITDAHANSCLTMTGQLLFNQPLKLPNVPPISIFDGKRSACDWPDDPNAVAPGLLDPHKQPRLIRDDFVGNANDSAWLANPEQPLSFPRVMGDAGAPRSLRTQELILTAQKRINGTDGLPGRGFTPDTMGKLLFADNSRAADLALNATVAMCQSVPFGLVLVDGNLVNVSEACPVLAGWKDHDYTADSRGSLLFANYWYSLLGGQGVEKLPWRVPFDPKDPVHTPNSLDTGSSALRDALARAVLAMRTAGIALNAPLSDVQKVTRGGEQIPIHGMIGELGVLNVIKAGQVDGKTDVVFGSSFIQQVRFTAEGPPQARSVLAYSQSADPNSAHYADQTKLFSAGQWVTERFTEDQIAASPALVVKVLD